MTSTVSYEVMKSELDSLLRYNRLFKLMKRNSVYGMLVLYFYDKATQTDEPVRIDLEAVMGCCGISRYDLHYYLDGLMFMEVFGYKMFSKRVVSTLVLYPYAVWRDEYADALYDLHGVLRFEKEQKQKVYNYS